MLYKGPAVLGSKIGNVKCSIILNFKVCSNTFSVTGSKIRTISVLNRTSLVEKN